jgi:hypothetical protein
MHSYTDSFTENILVAINEGNYTKYSEHFDATMKNALPEAVFQETNTLITSKIGAYDSKEFWKAEGKNQYAIVYYKATFTQESDDVINQGRLSGDRRRKQSSRTVDGLPKAAREVISPH